ncbi:U3 small nucleolar RNA-associated protein 6 homolog [Coccinella septempunctata]|uniref:U3 small nucleolar RNA-associated protein 6 homolog n=1 Tax=Coccinella septempunctata TaxID=41139 RepID=UPI001D0936B9|nr:U3 small nucleolar RNA-associated protein 6 homolog [Coccinella septempunctata]
MAELVQKTSEITVKELEDLKQSKLLSDDTIRRIVVARRHMESKINNVSKNIDDYRSYITHENLILNKIRKCRDKKKTSEKKNSVENSIIRRIRRLYETALQRFPNEYSLHEGFYKFCKENNYTPSASQAVDNMIKMFSYKPEVWKLAAGWYCHLNDTDKALQILHKGLTVNPESTVLFSTAIELEINQVSSNDCSPEQRLFKENKCGEKIKTYVNLILKNIKNLEYIISTLAILEGHNYTNPAQQLILDHLFQNHSSEDVVWHTLAKREKKGMHFVTNPNEQPRSNSFAKSCIMYCIDKYEQGLLLVAEDRKKKLWSNYLETLIEIQEENVQTQSIDREGLLKTALQQAHRDKCLEEYHYNIWVEMMPDDEARKTLEEATSIFPQSEELWKMQLRYAIKTDSVNDVNVTFKLGVLALQERALTLWLMLLRFHLLISENDKMRVIFEDGVRQPPEISDVLKPKYIEWIAFHEGIDVARARYSTLALERPYCKELHLLMGKLEFSQMNIDHDSWQKVHELACAQFGEEDVDVWINYIKFILFRKPNDLQNQITRICQESKNKLPPLLWQQVNEIYKKLISES